MLKGTQQIQIRLTKKTEPASKSTTEKQSSLNYNHELFDILRICRKVLADQGNVPPYVIFSDKTLIEMAAWFPQSPTSLLEISGVGQVKLDHYGDAFLHEITSFCTKHQIEEIAKPIERENRPRQRTSSQRRHVEVAKLFSEHNCLNQLQSELNLKLTTLLSHLYKYQTEVSHLPASDAFIRQSRIPPELQNQVLSAIEIHGIDRLRPLFDEMQEQVPYDELNLLRLHYMVHNPTPVTASPTQEIPAKKKTPEEKQAQNRLNGLPANAGLPWRDDERAILISGFEDGLSLADLADNHERTAGAIRSELKKQGLIDERGNPIVSTSNASEKVTEKTNSELSPAEQKLLNMLLSKQDNTGNIDTNSFSASERGLYCTKMLTSLVSLGLVEKGPGWCRVKTII